MNIFVTDEDPIKSAVALDDKRVNKMIVESCQILTSALILNGCPNEELPIAKATGLPYKLTHQHHPCTIWAKQNRSNYMWLVNHMMGLLVEFQMRRGSFHYTEINLPIARAGAKYLPEGDITPFTNCSMYKSDKNVFNAYRKTLSNKWKTDKRKPQWTKIAKPWFYKEI